MSIRTAFDADVLIYSAAPGHPHGAALADLLTERGEDGWAGIGSVLLLTEVLAKPMRENADSAEVAALVSVLSRVQLLPLDEATARLAVELAVAYGLRAADAAHLATAVAAGADRFLTNNRKDFREDIAEIDIVYPDTLVAAAAPAPEGT
ncbi:MAG: PIN domain-containing protein [Actinomycetia bacterium]|nr:PIN domain-containing protein [Actinomycetes bacterium]